MIAITELRNSEVLKANLLPMISALPPCKMLDLSALDARNSYPKQCTYQHACIGSEGQAIFQMRLELGGSLTSDNRLGDENQTVGHVAEASQTEQLQVKVGPADLIDGLKMVNIVAEDVRLLYAHIVYKSHLSIKSWVDIIHRKELSFNGIGVSRDDTTKAALPAMILLLIAVSFDIIARGHEDVFLLCVCHC